MKRLTEKRFMRAIKGTDIKELSEIIYHCGRVCRNVFYRYKNTELVCENSVYNTNSYRFDLAMDRIKQLKFPEGGVIDKTEIDCIYSKQFGFSDLGDFIA